MDFCSESNTDNLVGAEGVHLIGDLYRCKGDQTLLCNARLLRKACLELCQNAGLQIVGDVFHQFKSAGITGCVLLAESHVAIHTWPENSSVTIDVYVCNHSMNNEAKARRVFNGILKLLAPSNAKTHSVQRGEV